MTTCLRNNGFGFYLVLFLIPVVGSEVDSASETESINVKKELVSINIEVLIDQGISREVQSQLLCELDSEQKCTEEIIIVLGYGVSAKTSIAARSIQLVFDHEGAHAMKFETTFSSIPCALKIKAPQVLRDFVTTKIAKDSQGMGINNEINSKPKPLKLELNGVTRK